MTSRDHEAQEFLHACYGGAVDCGELPAVQLMHRLSQEQHLLEIWRISVGQPEWAAWTLFVKHPLVRRPDQANALRFLLSPDGCWPHCVTDQSAQACIAQGIGLAWFNRLEVAHDAPSGQRQGAFYRHFPACPQGALSAWAWSLSVSARCLKQCCPGAWVGVIGHSRGGKAALLAGATDPQLDAVISHNSGSAGASSLAVKTPGAERLAQLVQAFPHWLASSAAQPAQIHRLEQLDCIALWAQIAPRPLLILQAQGDLWANPPGARYSYQQLQPIWAQGNAPAQLQLIEREGGHAMQTSDWQAAAQFMLANHPR